MRRLTTYDEVYGYRYISGLRARVPHEAGGYLVRINEAGFRSNREYVRARTGPMRILVFGDSFTAGDGVRNEQRFSDVVESLVPGSEVYNFGLPGTGTDQQYLVFEHEVAATAMAYDLIVIAVWVENIRRNLQRFRPFMDPERGLRFYAKPFFERSADGTLTLRHSPVPPQSYSFDELPAEEQEQRAPDEDAAAQIRRRLRSMTAAEYDDPQGAPWQLMKAILLRWIAAAAAPVLILPVPLRRHVEGAASPTAYLARFGELAGPSVAIVDPLPHYHSRSDAERSAFFFERDVHPTPASHRVLAEALAGAVHSQCERRRHADS